MFDWLRYAARKLQAFIIGVPIYYAAPTMFVIGALDSSLLSLPEINDYLVVMRCIKDPHAVTIFPLFAAAGSVAGCMLLYMLMRRGGQAVLQRRFPVQCIERVERAYARFGFLAIAVPALLPPPMPFKIFVATAGAMEYDRKRFIITILIARCVRYYVEGALAIFYGERVLRFLEHNGWLIISVVASLIIIGLAVYLIVNRKRRTAIIAAPVETGGALNPSVQNFNDTITVTTNAPTTDGRGDSSELAAERG